MATLLAGTLVSCSSGDNVTDNDTCSYSNSNTGPYSPDPPDTNGAVVGQVISEMPHDHVAEGTKVTYEHNPPTSGCHYNLGAGKAPLSHGAYSSEIAPEYWVHNLEHGYIVVLYNCPSGCDSDFQKLRTWLQTVPPDQALLNAARAQPGATQAFINQYTYPKVVIMPDTKMDKKFAAVSWDYYDPMDTLDINEVQRFYDNHVGHSPESPSAP
jgi:hypothetical protein